MQIKIKDESLNDMWSVGAASYSGQYATGSRAEDEGSQGDQRMVIPKPTSDGSSNPM
jgi:hypothetical protein